ncbi:ABC transporter permease [Haliscomenobacter hydrossis]|nr:FtsX-like permease family protein [Haliscomenobacter hydrossis]
MAFVLYGVENIEKPLISKFDIEAKKSLQGTWLCVEKSCTQFVAPTGAELVMQFRETQVVKVKNTGTVHDPGLAPGSMEQAVYAYTSLENFENLIGQSQSEQRFLIKVKLQNPSKDDLKAIGNALSVLVKSSGGVVKTMLIPPPGEHPHQNIVNGVSFLLKIFGFVISLLGIILLSLILITWLYPQIPHIGIIKTLGGSSRNIRTSYFAILFLIIGIGLLIGLPLGYLIGQGYSNTIAFFQNFTPIKAPLPVTTHLLAIFSALILPFLLATIPLVNASRISVQSALSKVFYIPNKAFFKSTQAFIKNSSLKYGINNLFRTSSRTLLISLLFIMGFGLFITGANLKYSIQEDFRNLDKNSYYNVTVFLGDTLRGKLDFLEKLPFVDATSYVSRKSGSFTLAGQANPENTALKILSPDYVLSDALLMLGKIQKNCPDCIYIGMKYQSDFKQTALGDTIFFSSNGHKKPFIFSGVVKDLGSHPPALYQFNSVPNEIYRDLAIKVKDGFSLEVAKAQIEAACQDNGIEVKGITDATTRMTSLQNHLEPTFKIIEITGFLTLVLGLIGMLIVIGLSLQERSRETGIIKALGGTAVQISRLVLIEYLMVSVVCIAVGTGFSYFFTTVMGNILGTLILGSPILASFNWPYLVLTIVLLLVVLTLFISVYSYNKVKQSSNSLLNQVF